MLNAKYQRLRAYDLNEQDGPWTMGADLCQKATVLAKIDNENILIKV